MWLIIGDLHLTDRSQDDHRWKIFEWIRRQQQKRDTAATYLLGDLTDSKDRHSATLVNKIVAGLVSLKPPVYVLKGNHDYSDPKNPFFKFLNHIEGINFIIEPTVIKAIKPIALIPHFRKQDEFDQAIQDCVGKPVCGGIRGTPACFLVHQTFDGAIAESGVRLSGLSAAHINFIKPRLGVYAGDVHRPQTQGPVTYVGCPYQVRFGDNFEPRSLWLDEKGRRKELRFNAPRKWSLTVRGPENVLSHEELCEGDQVKLTIEVAREEAVGWKAIKQEVLAACKELRLEVYGVKLEVKTGRSPKRLQIQDSAPGPVLTFERFCKAEKVPTQIKKTGMELVNGDKNLL